MTDAYAFVRERVAETLAVWKSGTVRLLRTTNAAADPTEPWTPGESTTDIYDLDARVSSVAAQYLDDSLVVATDLMVVASAKARHIESAGEAVDGTPAVAIEPAMGDVIEIDGKAKEIKRVVPAPAAGPAAIFRIFVAS